MSPDTCAQLIIALLVLTAATAIVVQVRRASTPSVWALSQLMRLYTVVMFRQRVHGRPPITLRDGVLIYSNHRSPVDPMLVYTATFCKQDGHDVEPIEYMTAAEYCELGGVIGWFLKTARAIPVSRNGRDMGPAKVALRRLQEGGRIGIFPEGRLNPGDGLLPFNTGAAWLALRGNVPVVPAWIRNAPRSESMVQAFLVSQPADVIFGEPVDLTPWKSQRLSAAVLQEVAEFLRQQLLELAEQCEPAPPPRWPRLADGTGRRAA